MKTPRKHRSGFFDSPLKCWLFMLLPVVALYWPSVHFKFTSMDEHWLILNNEAALSAPDAVWKAFTQPLLAVYYRPLFMLSILLDYRLFGTEPYGYHAVNLALHLCSVALLFHFLRLNRAAPAAAAILALLFGLHPLMLHAVAWVAGRNDIILCIFALAAFNFLIMWLRTKKTLFLIIHFTCFACALFTKENAIILPVLFIALSYAEGFPGRRLLMSCAGTWTIMAGLWLCVRFSVVPQFEDKPQPLLAHTGDALGGLLLYLGKVFIPFKQSVLPTLQNGTLLPGAAVLLVLVWIVFRSRLQERARALCGVLIFLLLLMIPVWFATYKSNGEHYEQRAYLPMAGLALFASQVKLRAVSGWQRFEIAALVAVYFVMSSKRLVIYTDEETFVNTGLKEAPQFHVWYQYKATQLIYKESYAESIPLLTRGITLRPDRAQFYALRALAYYQTSQPLPAIDDYSTALELMGENPHLRMSRMLAYWMAGDLPAATRDMLAVSRAQRKISITPLAQEVAGKLSDSLNLLKKVCDLPGCRAEDCFRLAAIFEAMEDLENAGFYTRRALDADPRNKKYQEFLAGLLVRK